MKNIFEECNYDVDTFLEKYGESREITLEEANIIYSFCITFIKYNDKYKFLLGSGRSSCKPCIFKTASISSWIFWKTDERRGFYDAKCFDNCYDVCIYVFNEFLDKEQAKESIIVFNEQLNKEKTELLLKEYANKRRYTYKKE